MNTILVPTDFSKTASNAIDYAVEIARVFKARIILFHAYSMPVIPSEVPIILPVDEMEKNAFNGLKQIEDSIIEKHGKDIMIECVCQYGFSVDEINNYVNKSSIDLIVMGMEGTGFLMEKLVGSTTTSLIKICKSPVLAIDKNVRFKNLDKIVLACDYTEISDKSIFNPLKELIHVFKSNLSVLNVSSSDKQKPTIENAVVGIKLEHALEDVNHTFHFEINESVVDGINHFVKEHQVDMVVMIPHKHSILDTIFNGSETKHLAFHTHVPLLVLHG